MAILEVNRYEVEENAVFTDYSKEALLNNIDHFKHMTVYQRSALAKNIDSVKEVLGKYSKEYIHFLTLLVKDSITRQVIAKPTNPNSSIS